MTSNRTSVLVIFVAVFFLFFDTHFQMPILAPFAHSLGSTSFMIGLVVGAYSLFNILGNLASGYLIDARGWKIPLFVGTFLVSLSLFAYAYASSPVNLFVIRSFHGLAGGLVIPATLAFLVQAPFRAGTESLSKRMSFYGVAIGLASLTGPPLAGVLASYYDYQSTYLVVAFIMVIPVLLVILLKKEKTFISSSTASLKKNYRIVMRSTVLKTAFGLVFVLMGCTGTLISFFPGKVEELGANPAVTGALFTAFAATAVIVHLVWPALAKRFNLWNSILAGFSLLILSMVALHVLNLIVALAFALVGYGVGFGLLLPALLELVAKGSRPENKGLASGFFFMFFSLGVAVIPPFAGLLQQSIANISPFVAAASLALLLWIPITWRVKQAIQEA